jgi:hypothetical protein
MGKQRLEANVKVDTRHKVTGLPVLDTQFAEVSGAFTYLTPRYMNTVGPTYNYKSNVILGTHGSPYYFRDFNLVRVACKGYNIPSISV